MTKVVSWVAFAAALTGTGGPLGAADFNGDGFGDLAIGVRIEGVGEAQHAGAVNVLYGRVGGLAAAGNQLWTQNSPGVLGEAETDDWFGSALAAGDFNNDGFDELVIQAEGEGPVTGVAHVLRGSANGIVATGDQLLAPNSAGIIGARRFHNAVATGDFDGDLFEDLALGSERSAAGTPDFAGAVNVLYGTAAGLSSAGNQLWTQDIPGIAGVNEKNDRFGRALATGDFDNDGFADLAISAPFEKIGDAENAGAVHVLYGSTSGLATPRNQLWNQDSRGIREEVGPQNIFGSALASGDFNGDGFDDIVIGVDKETLPGAFQVGAVNVIYGSAMGLRAAGNQVWSQNSPGMVGSAAETGDHFGISLQVGDFNKDGRDDVGIGVTGEDISSIVNAGAVNILYGTPSGLNASGNQVWSQNSPGILGKSETQDSFGTLQ